MKKSPNLKILSSGEIKNLEGRFNLLKEYL